MDPFIVPTKRPTKEEFAVIAVFFGIAFVIIGIVAVVVGLRAPPEKHEQAVELARCGWGAIALGVIFMILLRWVIRRFKNAK